MLFIPNSKQEEMISIINSIYHHEYALVTLTPTMLAKSIIDASGLIRKLLKDFNIVDYSKIDQGQENKVELPVKFIENEINTLTATFYRPKTKQGDPRFWIKAVKQFPSITTGTMLYLTVKENTLTIIPLKKKFFNRGNIEQYFGKDNLIQNIESAVNELLPLVKDIARKGPVRSVGGKKHSPKDVGETFEQALKILPNSSKTADFKDLIELKAKRSGRKTKDTLFSMTPDYEAGQIHGSNEMIRTYGYPSKRHPGFIDLFITVSTYEKITPQGLFLKTDEEKEEIQQWHLSPTGKKTLTCVWHFKDIEARLKEKHSATLWILADEIQDDNDVYWFQYIKAQLTQQPLFSAFIFLVQQGAITYDWRGRVQPDGKKYKDKGHCWRINPKKRKILFGESSTISLTNE